MKKVKLTTIDNVKNFCHAAMNVDGEVTITSGKYVVDGKSILGILSLNLSDFVNVTVKCSKVDKEDVFWNALTLMGIETV